MKCENCGKHDANYHYTSNINGAVTEKHLCSECAGKLGLETDIFAGGGDMFESMIAGMFGRSRRLFDAFSPFAGMSFSMPTMLLPRIEIKLENSGKDAETTADPELKKAREINALRAQMSAAAEKEDFEKAAEIRDRIRELESAEESGKASE